MLCVCACACMCTSLRVALFTEPHLLTTHHSHTHSQPVISDQQIVRAWLMPTGAVLCVDQGFMDYAGWSAKVRGCGCACPACLGGWQRVRKPRASPQAGRNTSMLRPCCCRHHSRCRRPLQRKCRATFMDVFHAMLQDLLGKHFEVLGAREGELTALVDAASKCSMEELGDGKVQVRVGVHT